MNIDFDAVYSVGHNTYLSRSIVLDGVIVGRFTEIDGTRAPPQARAQIWLEELDKVFAKLNHSDDRKPCSQCGHINNGGAYAYPDNLLMDPAHPFEIHETWFRRSQPIDQTIHGPCWFHTQGPIMMDGDGMMTVTGALMGFDLEKRPPRP